MTASRFAHRRLRVYVAGPYTRGDVAANVAAAMDCGDQLIRAGFAPFVPHLSHFLHLHHAQPYKVWLDLDLEWLPLCDVMVRLPGESPGAEIETVRATELGIPIVRLNGLSPIEDQIESVLK